MSDLLERAKQMPSSLNDACRTIDLLREQLVKAHAVLEQCQDCIRGETPEDMTHEEAREDTIAKIRGIILTDEQQGEKRP